jgi:hypothetical protein
MYKKKRSQHAFTPLRCFTLLIIAVFEACPYAARHICSTPAHNHKMRRAAHSLGDFLSTRNYKNSDGSTGVTLAASSLSSGMPSS